jgi:hypothetical protein
MQWTRSLSAITCANRMKARPKHIKVKKAELSLGLTKHHAKKTFSWPCHFTPEDRAPLDRLGGPQSRSGPQGEVKNHDLYCYAKSTP